MEITSKDLSGKDVKFTKSQETGKYRVVHDGKNIIYETSNGDEIIETKHFIISGLKEDVEKEVLKLGLQRDVFQ